MRIKVDFNEHPIDGTSPLLTAAIVMTNEENYGMPPLPENTHFKFTLKNQKWWNLDRSQDVTETYIDATSSQVTVDAKLILLSTLWNEANGFSVDNICYLRVNVSLVTDITCDSHSFIDTMHSL